MNLKQTPMKGTINLVLGLLDMDYYQLFFSFLIYCQETTLVLLCI